MPDEDTAHRDLDVDPDELATLLAGAHERRATARCCGTTAAASQFIGTRANREEAMHLAQHHHSRIQAERAAAARPPQPHRLSAGSTICKGDLQCQAKQS
jgi:hypothetical protein